MSTPNWGKLYTQGRCKAIGVPWNTEEAYAALNLRIPADFVRAGVLTIEEYESALKKGKNPVDKGIVLERAEKKTKKKK